jgi:integrase
MPKIKFTDRTIAAIPHAKKQIEFWDLSLPTFGVRVGASTKTFIVMRRGSRKVLGRYPILPLAEARDRAKRFLYENTVPNPRRPSISYKDAVNRYLEMRELDTAKGTFREYTRHLRKNFAFPDHIEDISQSQVHGRLDRIPGQSERAHAARALKTFLNWCVQRGYLGTNPMLSIKMPKEPSSRERVLSDDELVNIWRSLSVFPETRYAIILRILMLTGQRANQIASLQKSWIDNDKLLFNFPKEVMKAGKPHTLPFGKEVTLQLKKINRAGEYCFSPPEVDRPFTTWSKNKVLLDNGLELPHWTIHDLRRTWSTNAPRLGITSDITERVLAHTAPSGKIAAVYDRFKYEPQMRDAMLKMESFILDLVDASLRK